MSYATEREYNRAEKALVILRLIQRKKRITVADAMRVAGCSRITVWRVLLDIERALDGAVGREGRYIIYRE